MKAENLQLEEALRCWKGSMGKLLIDGSLFWKATVSL